MRKNNKTGKRLRLIPLILGGYGAFLGFGLVAIGLAEIKEGVGILRLLMGLGLAGLGLLGIWDGVRDLVKPNKKPEQRPSTQFVLTDTSGNRSSNVTVEVLQKQLESLMESDKGGVFKLQILPPFPVQQIGNISQIFCIFHEAFRLAAFLDESEGGYESYHKSAEFDEAKGWFEKLLAGSADLSGWKKIENGYDDEDESSEEEDSPEDTDEPAEQGAGFDNVDFLGNTADAPQESIEAFWHQLRAGQEGQVAHWHQCLVIFGESWHDEHRFFSVRDVELAIEGIHEGKYIKAVLELGTQTVELFPGLQNDLMVIWCTNNTGKGNVRFLAKEGTLTQARFWLVNYLDQGFFTELDGWADVTSQIEKAKRKGKKNRG